ncbi:hypothetical protein A1356_11890 [Methylomonas koyamae]|jgi:hypothetical protein|uniref:Uncharacterized protein n=1 Tax=Methylomonas koyamae TaxID=702114 RepID=A0AA91DCR8_9GAMM|nr:hypothetical protein A1356_11890 [Methylomonas koyamae]
MAIIAGIVLILILYFVAIPILKVLLRKISSLLELVIALGVVGVVLVVCLMFPILFIPLILYFLYSKSQSNSDKNSQEE